MTKIDVIASWAEEENSLVRNCHGLLLFGYTSEIIYVTMKICFSLFLFYSGVSAMNKLLLSSKLILLL